MILINTPRMTLMTSNFFIIIFYTMSSFLVYHYYFHFTCFGSQELVTLLRFVQAANDNDKDKNIPIVKNTGKACLLILNWMGFWRLELCG